MPVMAMRIAAAAAGSTNRWSEPLSASTISTHSPWKTVMAQSFSPYCAFRSVDEEAPVRGVPSGNATTACAFCAFAKVRSPGAIEETSEFPTRHRTPPEHWPEKACSPVGGDTEAEPSIAVSRAAPFVKSSPSVPSVEIAIAVPTTGAPARAAYVPADATKYCDAGRPFVIPVLTAAMMAVPSTTGSML